MHFATETPERNSISPDLASSLTGKSGKFYERAGVKQVLNLLESLACVVALLLVCTPLEVYLAAGDVLYDPRLDLWFSIGVLLGMAFLHWRLNRFLVPIRGALREERRVYSENLKAKTKSFWNVGPAGLFFLGYLTMGVAVVFTLTSQSVESDVPDMAVRLFRDGNSVTAFTLQPLFFILAGVLWQARRTNLFLAERCERLQASGQERT